MNRQSIRTMFRDGIEGTNRSVSVFTERHIENITSVMPAAVVIIEQVQVTSDLKMNPHYTCSVDSTFLIDGTFDELDSLVDAAIDGIIAEALANYGGIGCTLQTINYMDDLDAGITAAALTWEVFYV